MVKINRNFFNCSAITLSITTKLIFLKNKNKNKNISKTFSYSSLCCIVGSLFLVFIGIDFVVEDQGPQQQYQYNIINIAWAENINGTVNADNITGTINKDTIRGFGGNDTIAGKEAGDDISGESGDDIIYGNEGRDLLKGKSGNDHIEGGEGNDRIYGDRGNDMLVGGPGKDIFICRTATDTITDFNITQKDTIPENDCENIKYGSNDKNLDSNIILSQNQQQKQEQVDNN